MNSFSALVCDYDGTLATRGIVSSETTEALHAVLDSGKKLLLATGRELPDLLAVCPEIELFEWVIAENGAVLFHPATGKKETLGQAPPESMFRRLREEHIGPVARGEVVAAVDSKYATQLKASLQAQKVPYHVILNKDSAMILPVGIDKGTGVLVALHRIGISPREVVAVGDGENDLHLFRVVGCRVALANAVEELCEAADFVTSSPNGEGVREMIERLFEPNELVSERELREPRI